MPLDSNKLEMLRARFLELVRPFDVHPTLKQFATTATHNGGPHIEQHGQTYAYVVTERGSEYERRETSDPDELLYWLVSDTTWEVALQFELSNRIEGKDFRRLLFFKHAELLESICTEWGRRKRLEYEKVLAEYPYSDEARPNEQ